MATEKKVKMLFSDAIIFMTICITNDLKQVKAPSSIEDAKKNYPSFFKEDGVLKKTLKTAWSSIDEE